jgi:hypothetical protein
LISAIYFTNIHRTDRGIQKAKVQYKHVETGITVHGMHLSHPFSVRHINAYGDFKAHLQETNKYYLTDYPFWHIF